MRKSSIDLLAEQKLDFAECNYFPLHIRQYLSDGFSRPEVLEYFLSESEISRVLFKNPADFEMLEIVYFGKSVRGISVENSVDKFLSHSLSGQALRDRLSTVSTWMANFLKEKLTNSETSLKILDLGAGPGPYAFATIEKLSDDGLLSQIKWKCVDVDRLALAHGQFRSLMKKVDQVVEFQRLDFLSKASYEATIEDQSDFGLVIGILCSMDIDTAIMCLKKMRPHFKKNAEILAATLLIKSFDEDPLTFRVLCNVLGWQLKPKTDEQVRHIFKEAGYEIINLFSERSSGDGQYAIVHAQIGS